MIDEEKYAECGELAERILYAMTWGYPCYIPLADVRRYNQLMKELWGEEIGEDPEIQEAKDEEGAVQSE